MFRCLQRHKPEHKNQLYHVRLLLSSAQNQIGAKWLIGLLK